LNKVAYIVLWICCSYNLLAQECAVGNIIIAAFSPAVNLRITDTLIKVPVVVHVVYNNIAQNISDEQIKSQIAVLNLDFNKENTDTTSIVSSFKSLVGNARIKFYLADKDTVGNTSNGITRTPTTHGVFGNNDIHYYSLGGEDAWDTKKYLNIWVCDLTPGISGYATAPSTTSVYEDGVVVDYQYFGTINTSVANRNKGRTTTHEVAHWLGLKHTWGSGNCTDADSLADTPSQDQSSTGCDVSKTSCGHLNMVQNFMDLSDDDCRLFFTQHQTVLMRSVITTQRPEVCANGNLLTNAETIFANTPNDYIVFPNPVSDGKLIVKGIHNMGEQLFIHDLVGVEVFSSEPSISGEVNINSLKTGIYILTIQNNTTHKHYQSKLIIINSN
jgi:hypothetical protein